MHSKIYQIGLKPINKEDYASSTDFYENSGDFADYIGDEYPEKERLEAVEGLAEILPEFFDYVGDGTLRYKGMGTFLLDWTKEIKRQANEMTAENVLEDARRYKMSYIMSRTHRDIELRFYIEDWSGCAEPLGEFVKYLSMIKEGTRLYVGAVIDFHF